MILEIPGVVSELVPGLLDGGEVSVAYVRTTQPKYLVFGLDPSRPACVVQFGPGDEMERVHGILSRLHGMLPDVVAEPLACAPWRDGEYVQIQSGLAGLPWFRLSDRLRSRGEWYRLRARALTTLARLHSAVRAVPEWSCSTFLGEELRRQAAACQGRGMTFSSRAKDCIGASGERLDELGEIPCHWQHGDYCLNNLLVSRSRLAIIDFEEFGHTSMPLHDQIGLALSVHDMAPDGSGPEMMRENLSFCLEAGSGCPFSPDHLSGLFLHHLLWRIKQCLDRPARAQMQGMLTAIVEEFAASPRALFPTSCGSPRPAIGRAW